MTARSIRYGKAIQSRWRHIPDGRLSRRFIHRDIVAGNVFRDGFGAVFKDDVARRLRRFLREDRFIVCSRCCGLYLTPEYDRPD